MTVKTLHNSNNVSPRRRHPRRSYSPVSVSSVGPSSAHPAYKTAARRRTKELSPTSSRLINYSHIRYSEQSDGNITMESVPVNERYSPMVEGQRIAIDIDDDHTQFQYSDEDWDTHIWDERLSAAKPRRIVKTRVVKVPVERVVERERKIAVSEPTTRVVKVPVKEPKREVKVIQPPAITKVKKEVQEKIVERIVEVPVQVEVEKIVEKIVEVPVEVERVVEVPKIEYVEKIVHVPKIVEKEKFIEVRVEVPVEKIVEREVRVEVPYPVYKEVVREVPVTVEKIVEKPVPQPVLQPSRIMLLLCNKCRSNEYNQKVIRGEIPMDPAATVHSVHDEHYHTHNTHTPRQPVGIPMTGSGPVLQQQNPPPIPALASSSQRPTRTLQHDTHVTQPPQQQHTHYVPPPAAAQASPSGYNQLGATTTSSMFDRSSAASTTIDSNAYSPDTRRYQDLDHDRHLRDSAEAEVTMESDDDDFRPISHPQSHPRNTQFATAHINSNDGASPTAAATNRPPTLTGSTPPTSSVAGFSTPGTLLGTGGPSPPPSSLGAQAAPMGGPPPMGVNRHAAAPALADTTETDSFEEEDSGSDWGFGNYGKEGSSNAGVGGVGASGTTTDLRTMLNSGGNVPNL